jgi:hypothetical protein
MMQARSTEQRRADALEMLDRPGVDGWVASASPGGEAHLVPLSLAWTGERLILAAEGEARTTRNLSASRACRVGVGATRDVVMIDATVELVVSCGEASTAIADAFAGQADWDPRQDGEAYVFIVLQPTRIQVWREVDEIAGRTIMRRGEWVTP